MLDLYLSKRIEYDFQRLHRTAYFDGLTGIPNRVSADVHALGCEDPSLISVAVADLDGLKIINDTFGHQAGDALIQDFANSFYDAAYPGGFAARNGGDEFLAIFYGEDSEEQTVSFCRKLRKLVDHKNNTAAHPVSYSIGCASGKGLQCTSAAEIISCADNRMYLHKQEKKSARKMSEGRH